MQMCDWNKPFLHILQNVSNNDKVYKTVQLILGNVYNKNKNSHADELKTLKEDLYVYEKRKEKVQILMLDGDLSFADFQSFKSKIEPEIEALTERIKSIEQLRNSDEEEVIEFGFQFLSNLDKLLW